MDGFPASETDFVRFYRTAAALPRVRHDGPASDGLGRRGVEISVGTGDDELKMIFNPSTGAFLVTSGAMAHAG